MKLFVVVFMIGVATAARLENTYLPPTSSRTAGGSGNFLSTPFQGSHGSSFGGNFRTGGAAPSANYGSPVPAIRNYNQQGAAPAPAYGVPGANGYSGNGGQAYHSAPVNILRFNNENNGDGSYQFDFETENKISQQEQGQLRNAGTDQETNVVHGSYSYASPDGQILTVNYVADENGFQPVGDHLPTPPPIPAEIQKSLQFNAAAESAPGYHSGAQENGQYQDDQSGQYQAPQANRQYQAARTSTFNSQGGYHY